MDKEVETIEMGTKEKILQYYFLNRSQVHGWGAAVVVVGALLVGVISVGPNDADYKKASEAFSHWKEAPQDEARAREMRKSLKKIPGLDRALEAEIAQTYLAQGMVEQGIAAVHDAIKRLDEASPFHAQFAEISLLIEKGEHQRALELSVALKEKLESSLDPALWKGSRMGGGSALYVSNLLRIGCLQKQLGNGPGELAAWEELKGLMEGGTSAAAQLLQASFGNKGFSLADYISLRERSIVR